MEIKEKIKIAFTIACFAAISLFFTIHYRNHRRQKRQSQNTCYLKTESKPQNAFKRVLADNSYTPFKHLKLAGSSDNNENSSSEHPYKAEIEALLKSPPVEFGFVDDGNVDLKLSDSYVWIETELQLQELVDVLSKERVFAVDTEQHSFRSFLGFTALIQISTNHEDYLVDTIALHDVMGIFRPVFANPAICKVFHGADNDVLWLQRDFHIYIVNLFDTAKACEVLAKPQKSLAYLLEIYCGVPTNKQLQREDWRCRPLSVEMVQYARTDAHYLLYIAHSLASVLMQQNSAGVQMQFVCNFSPRRLKHLRESLLPHLLFPVISIIKKAFQQVFVTHRYLRRDLAKLVDENPSAIMLLFEPKGRPEDEDNDFYIQSKKNICVGCGEGNHYLRYRIIPSCYRMHFPEHLKSHRSHDIVLLCVDCHEIAHAAAEKYKRQIALEFGIPLFVRKVVDSRQAQDASGSSASLEEAGVSPLELRTAAMALIRYGPGMPSKRREELMQIVMKYYGGREISEEDLQRALLVGMSPHERKRLEKKRGSAFKKSTKGIIPDEQESRGGMEISSTVNTSNTDHIDDLHAFSEKNCSKEDSNFLATEDMDVSSFSLCPDLDDNVEILAADNEDINSDGSRVSEAKYISSLDTDLNETRSPSNGTVNLVQPRSDRTLSPKHNSKLSLLGHGPHGKQVVDHLLKEYGDDGIRQFCQRWRQVFVEATHPRFLPAGWDVMHSGRRDFGEFSVYNPAKRASAAAKE